MPSENSPNSVSTPQQVRAAEGGDPVNPSHYRDAGNYSGLHVTEAWGSGFHIGNALKYIQRAGKKLYSGMDQSQSELTDLRKARWYIQRYMHLHWPDQEDDPLDGKY